MKKPGRYWQTDSEGYLLNDARAAYIQPPYDALAADVVAAYTQHIPADLHSIYVTGSVARGMALAGQSDFNAFAVLTEFTDGDLVLRDWITPAEDALLEKHPFITDIQLELWPHFYVFTDPARFSIGGFIIKTHSVCLWGSDLAPELPEYKVSPAIANDDLVQLAADLDEAQAEIEANPHPDLVRYWCGQAARHVLWSAYGLVQMRTGRHTRDLDLCAADFARYTPEHAASAGQALAYAQQPTTDSNEALAFINDAREWLLPLAEAWLDAHNPERAPALKVEDVAEGE